MSQAAAQQRRGRAGRVRPGVCFRLFSRATWNSLQVPRCRRTAFLILRAQFIGYKI